MSLSVTTARQDRPPALAVRSPRPEVSGSVAILEDDPTLGELALELCRDIGAEPVLHSAPANLLEELRVNRPRALVLDWLLQGELGAAAFMAVRHRYPQLPVVCWTASPAWNLPHMIRRDPATRVVDKAAGADAFEAAVRWALG